MRKREELTFTKESQSEGKQQDARSPLVRKIRETSSMGARDRDWLLPLRKRRKDIKGSGTWGARERVTGRPLKGHDPAEEEERGDPLLDSETIWRRHHGGAHKRGEMYFKALKQTNKRS